MEDLFYLQQFKAKGYHLVSAKVDYILYWEAEDKEQEDPIVFPVLELERYVEERT